MSQWKGVLEALHSSLIDELLETFPKIKPELGLPRRETGWTPSLDLPICVACSLTVDLQTGLGAIRLNQSATSQLNMSPKDFFELVLKRAEPQLKRRSIHLRKGNIIDLTKGESPPSALPHLTKIIWIPLNLQASNLLSQYELGIGI